MTWRFIIETYRALKIFMFPLIFVNDDRELILWKMAKIIVTIINEVKNHAKH